VRSPAYPFERVLQTALLASDGKPENLPALRKALADPHPVIRYWGAVGCSVLGPKAEPAAADLRKAMKSDASPVNRITAAEALGRAGHKKEAVAAIKKELAAADADMLALHALEALDQLGPESILAPEEIASLKKREFNYALRLAPRVGTGEAPAPKPKKRKRRPKRRAKQTS
jgi:HEAT repeat protein